MGGGGTKFSVILEVNCGGIILRKTSQYMWVILAMVLVLIFVGTIAIALHRNRDTGGKPNDSTSESQTDKDQLPEKWQEGVIKHDGKSYKYKSNLQVYLIMGVDKSGPVQAVTNQTEGGQSDALFMVVLEKGTENMSVVSINRNSMTRIETCDENGKSTGNTIAQICTQHGFGDGLKQSCNKVVEAVSYLFYNQPIDGYISMNMDAMSILNDAVGGVEVEVLQDMHYPDAGVDLKKGETVTLNGTEAYFYLRGRDTNEFDSATMRLRRQEQFMAGFIRKLEGMANDIDAIDRMHASVEDYLVTSPDFAEIMAEVGGYHFDPEKMYTVPGETVMGEKFEEYHVDDDALYDLILEIFYDDIT